LAKKQFQILTFPQIQKLKINICYLQTLKYEIKVRTSIHLSNEVEDSFIEGIQVN